MINFSYEDFKKYSEILFSYDSPTGFTHGLIKVVEDLVKELGYQTKVLHNGALEVSIDGEDNSKVVATSAHIDTNNVFGAETKIPAITLKTRINKG